MIPVKKKISNRGYNLVCRDQVHHQVQSQVRVQVQHQVWDPVGNQVLYQVRDQVWIKMESKMQ